MLKFFDPLQHYTNNTEANRGGWIASGLTYVLSGGRFPGTGYAEFSATDQLAAPINSLASVYRWGFAFLQPGVPGASADNAEFFALRQNSGANLICDVRKTPALGFNIEDANQAVVFAGANGAYQLNTWHWLEGRLAVDGVVGDLQIRIDNTEVVNLANQDFDDGFGDVSDMFFLCGTNSGGLQLQDFFFWDDDSITDPDDPFVDVWMGDMRMVLDVADASAQEEWTRVGGGAANYEAVDEALPGIHDGDTTHLTSTLAAQRDRVSFPSYSGAGAVIGVAAMAEMAKSDAGAVTDVVRLLVESNGSVDLGVDLAGVLTSPDYTMQRHVAWLDPDGSVAWVPGKVSASTLGFERV